MNEWELTYSEFKPEQEPLREALCTLGNGYFATRGAAEESHADDTHYPGTYLAGGYNRLKSEISGRIIENEDLVNWPNWLELTFKCEDDTEWFKLERTEILHYEQTLNMKGGFLKREMRFRDHAQRETLITSIRAVSMENPHVAMIKWSLTPENWSGKITVRSSLDGSVKNEGVSRYKELSNNHLRVIEKGISSEDCVYLLVQTTQSRTYMAMAARSIVFKGIEPIVVERNNIEDDERVIQEFSFNAEKMVQVEIEKTITLFTSNDNAITEPLQEANEAIKHIKRFEVLFDGHKKAWEKIWRRFDMEIKTPEGTQTQMLLRLHIFHLIQTCSTHTIDLDIGVPARGWHGEAYRGHIFWDELFILPFINLHMPDLTRSLLLYRYRRLDKARIAAKEAGFEGAMFPWQSGSNGREESQVVHLNPKSGNWVPDHTYLQRHVNMAIAFNIWQYYTDTENIHFLRFYGAEMFLEIAKFISSLTSFDAEKQKFVILGVVGPDEFHTAYPEADKPGIDNNAYTNFMAAWVFVQALKILDLLDKLRKTELLEKLKITEEELRRWKKISCEMFIPFHDDQIISQFEGYDQLPELDWDHYREKHGSIKRLDRILEAEGDSVNNYKASKQGDVLMLFYLFSSEELVHIFSNLNIPFDPSTIPKIIQYYVHRTSDGSTLSRIVRAWVESRSSREASWQEFEHALRSDIEDVQGGTTPEGIHLGSMVGTADIVQRCYTGIDIRDNVLWINPYLPEELETLSFRITYKGSWLHFTISPQECSILYEDGKDESEKITIGFHNELIELSPGQNNIFCKTQPDKTSS